MKKIKEYARSDKGSITTVVVVTVLFFVIVLSTAYMVTATLRKSQLKSEITAKEIYEKDFNRIDEIKDSLKTHKVKIPEGFYYAGGTIDSGLVISDNSADANRYENNTTVGTNLTGNQYVWIEVPRTTEVYPTAGLAITTFTDAEYTKIENDLHTYTNAYRNGTSNTDTYFSDTATGLTSSQYSTLKKTMLKSVYQNGGFWIGRYEAGISTPRTSLSNTIADSLKPTSKANEYPINYVTCSQAQTLASRVNSGSYTSSLMFGVQWDLVLKYIETKRIATITNIQTQLNSNSKDIGNCRNSSFTIDRGQYSQHINYSLSTIWNPYTTPTTGYVENKEKKVQSSGNGVLLTTGASDRNSLQNIYDLAGNVWEWTLEKTSDNRYPCDSRGGCHISDGSNIAASYRLNNDMNRSGNIGFRIALY